MEQIDEAERAVGNAGEHLERVAHMDADIAKALIADVAERGDDAVQEGLAADEAMVGKKIGAIGEMFAAAEADFEMERAVVAEKAGGGHVAFFGNGEGGQQRVDQLLLAGAELVSRLTAIEAVERGRIAGFVRGHERALSGG